MFDPRAVGMTFHLTTPTDELPTAGDVLAVRSSVGAGAPRRPAAVAGVPADRAPGRGTHRPAAQAVLPGASSLPAGPHRRVARSHGSRTGTTTCRPCWNTRPLTASCIGPIAPSTSRSCSDWRVGVCPSASSTSTRTAAGRFGRRRRFGDEIERRRGGAPRDGRRGRDPGRDRRVEQHALPRRGRRDRPRRRRQRSAVRDDASRRPRRRDAPEPFGDSCSWERRP